MEQLNDSLTINGNLSVNGTIRGASGGAVAILDTSTGDIQASPGTAAAGTSGQGSDAKHIHPSPAFFAPAGLTGATALTRYVGGTSSGAPATGTFALGDFAIDQTGKIWICTSAPGTWTQVGGSGSVASNTDWINITAAPYSCIPGGSHDCTTGFAAAQTASVNGGGIPIYAPTGVYLFNSTAISNIAGQGPVIGAAPWDPYDYGDTYGTIFTVGASYAGTSFLGQSTTSSSFIPGPRLYNIAVDGSNAPSGCNGMVISGHISDGQLVNVVYSRFPGNGFQFGSGGGQNPLTWRFSTVRARQCGGNGWQINALTDSQGWDMAARGCGGVTNDGVALGFIANSYFDMRSEFSGNNGFNLQSQGGYTLRCSTDRNAASGVAVTGGGPFSNSYPIILYCDNLRRDGSSGSGAGLAVVGAVTPVIVKTLNIYTGINDGGGGSNTPVNGVTVQNSSYVQLPEGAYVQANTTPLNILGGNTYLDMDASRIITATGTDAAQPGGTNAPTFGQSWHNLTNANLSNSFTIGSGGYVRWRLCGRHLELSVQLLTVPSGGKADGTAVLASTVLPTYVQPANALTQPVYLSTNGMAGLKILTTGEVDIYGVASASAATIDGTVRFPLD